MEDGKIVELYLSRDESAISQTAEKYGKKLRTLAYGITEDGQAAEECENDTYLQAWDSIPPHEPRTYLYAFLARITRHIALNMCRSRNALKRNGHICTLTEEMEQCIPSPDDSACRLDDMALTEALNGFLAALSEEKRNIFLRRYWFMDSVAAIAKRFALSESKVKTTLFRCRSQLREYLVKEGYNL
ncbi:MAG: RNA polymerase sigma factor [Clostridia bacterium]|nr:RNA polymerase sigma factor [Clostridia bacterium]